VAFQKDIVSDASPSLPSHRLSVRRQSGPPRRQSEEFRRQSERIRRQPETLRRQSKRPRRQSEEFRRQSERIRRQSEEFRRQSERLRRQPETLRRHSLQSINIPAGTHAPYVLVPSSETAGRAGQLPLVTNLILWRQAKNAADQQTRPFGYGKRGILTGCAHSAT